MEPFVLNLYKISKLNVLYFRKARYYMEGIISLICTIIVMVILFSLIGPIIVYLLPIILIVLFFRYMFMPRHTTHTYYYDDDTSQNTHSTSKPKHDAIDVEYTEHEEDNEG